MVPFGGWDMPVEYAGLISEHMAVRTAAGLFDVSHMGEVTVEGPGALAFLQGATSNDVSKLADGQAQYSSLPMENGAPVDDIVVLRRAADRYLIVVNAGNIEKDFQWLSRPRAGELRGREPQRRLRAAGPAGPARAGDPAGPDAAGPLRAQVLPLRRRRRSASGR